MADRVSVEAIHRGWHRYPVICKIDPATGYIVPPDSPFYKIKWRIVKYFYRALDRQLRAEGVETFEPGCIITWQEFLRLSSQ